MYCAVSLCEMYVFTSHIFVIWSVSPPPHPLKLAYLLLKGDLVCLNYRSLYPLFSLRWIRLFEKSMTPPAWPHVTYTVFFSVFFSSSSFLLSHLILFMGQKGWGWGRGWGICCSQSWSFTDKRYVRVQSVDKLLWTVPTVFNVILMNYSIILFDLYDLFTSQL